MPQNGPKNPEASGHTVLPDSSKSSKMLKNPNATFWVFLQTMCNCLGDIEHLNALPLLWDFLVFSFRQRGWGARFPFTSYLKKDKMDTENTSNPSGIRSGR